MALRVGILSVAHMHATSYAVCLADRTDANLVGVWDDESDRGKAFAAKYEVPWFASVDDLLANCDAVSICSENMRHAEHLEWAARAGIPALCEKPLVASEADALRVQRLIDDGAWIMTAFPCPYAPAFQQALGAIKGGQIGRVVGIAGTNHGSCPGGWFIESEKSGGGAMIDHTVHVADLFHRVLGAEPTNVRAQAGSPMYGESWDDTAMLTLDYADGVFATLDSSWSRPKGYMIWGDVTLRITGEEGVIEVDLFNPGVDAFGADGLRRRSTGSNLDRLMMDEFIAAVTEGRPAMTSGTDGLAASRVALAGYSSLRG
ncbi:MAG: Gfo/Idh/MocA family oxidoreductase [Fimbriimonadaceae bacterium]|nr:Gfo/Idh/MocA family oxidoreductase [Fimbriimonadaceae bacterium]